MGLRVSDWIGFNCGDKVCATDDERHVGRVEAVHSGGFQIKVQWEESGHISFLSREELTVIERAKEMRLPPASCSRPATIVLSPKRRLEMELSR
jgi:hypothetical protein